GGGGGVRGGAPAETKRGRGRTSRRPPRGGPRGGRSGGGGPLARRFEQTAVHANSCGGDDARRCIGMSGVWETLRSGRAPWSRLVSPLPPDGSPSWDTRPRLRLSERRGESAWCPTELAGTKAAAAPPHPA